MRQEYSCEKCGVKRHVLLHEYDDVWGVAQAIFKDHQKWSPECEGGKDTLRVLGEPFGRNAPERDAESVQDGAESSLQHLQKEEIKCLEEIVEQI